MKTQQFFMVCAAAGATAVVIGGAATAALAQQQNQVATVVGERPDEQGRSMIVSYRDLNLAAARDAQILHRRVSGAARMVCQTDDFLVGEQAHGRCVSYAWSGAKPQIALAMRRASEIASTGASSIPLVAITVVARR